MNECDLPNLHLPRVVGWKLELDVHVISVNVDSVEDHEGVDGLDFVVLDVSWDLLSDVLGGLRDSSEDTLVLGVDQGVISELEGSSNVDGNEVDDVVGVVDLVGDNEVVTDIVLGTDTEDEVVELSFV